MVDLVTGENGKYTLNGQVPASYLCVKIIITDHCKQVTQSQTRSPLTRYGITIYPDGNYQFKDAPSSDYCIEETTTTIPDQYKPVNTSSSSSPSDSPFSPILDDSIIKSCFTVSGALDCQNLALSPFYEITTATTTETTTATITSTTATTTAITDNHTNNNNNSKNYRKCNSNNNNYSNNNNNYMNYNSNNNKNNISNKLFNFTNSILTMLKLLESVTKLEIGYVFNRNLT
ncbi:hypothetical protein ACTFIZ_011477 [Dictyostelium cf. discoideum]